MDGPYIAHRAPDEQPGDAEAIKLNGSRRPGSTPDLPPSDTAAAVRFLSKLLPQGRLCLVSIVPHSPIVEGITFEEPRDSSAIALWIDKRQGRANIYYVLNEPVVRSQQAGRSGNPTEADIQILRGIAIDVDPAESEESSEGGYDRERARLLRWARELNDAFLGGPTAIVDSGNGIQAVWLF